MREQILKGRNLANMGGSCAPSRRSEQSKRIASNSFWYAGNHVGQILNGEPMPKPPTLKHLELQRPLAKPVPPPATTNLVRFQIF
jgi:hypothetical protein